MNKLLLLICFTCLTGICRAQNYSPLELSKKIFSRDTFPEIKKYSINEYEGHPNGRDLSGNVTTTFKLLAQNTKTAVVAITISDSTGKGLDTYLHFEKDTIWKASAFRALAMTGIIEGAYNELLKLTPNQIDSLIAAPKKENEGEKLFTSKEEYLSLLGKTKLILATDNELIAHFNKNKPAFEKLKNELLAQGIMNTKSDIKQIKDNLAYRKQLTLLYIDNVSPDYESSEKNLNFLIGGILDNTVGYLYISDKKNVPEMSPSRFIMVSEIGEGWYLYKTT